MPILILISTRLKLILIVISWANLLITFAKGYCDPTCLFFGWFVIGSFVGVFVSVFVSSHPTTACNDKCETLPAGGVYCARLAEVAPYERFFSLVLIVLFIKTMLDQYVYQFTRIQGHPSVSKDNNVYCHWVNNYSRGSLIFFSETEILVTNDTWF